jgi:hypothetical protein
MKKYDDGPAHVTACLAFSLSMALGIGSLVNLAYAHKIYADSERQSVENTSDVFNAKYRINDSNLVEKVEGDLK